MTQGNRNYRRVTNNRKQTRTKGRSRSIRKQSTRGPLVLLGVFLLLLVAWWVYRLPPGYQIMLGVGVVLGAAVLLWILWNMRRPRQVSFAASWVQRATPKIEAVNLAETGQLEIESDVIAEAISNPHRLIEIDDLKCLTDVEFEYFVGDVLMACEIAYDLQRRGGSGDRGVDLLGVDKYRQPFIVQCKFYYGHNVTPTDVLKLMGSQLNFHAREAWLVTTSNYSPQARLEGKIRVDRGEMFLKTGKDLLVYINEKWHELPDKWKWKIVRYILQNDLRRQMQGNW